MGIWKNDYLLKYKKEISRAAGKVLGILNLNNWRVEVSFPTTDNNGTEKWQVTFFNSSGQPHSVSFERPPNADEGWYVKTLMRKLEN